MQGFIRLIRRWPLWVKLLATLMAIAVVCVSTFSIINSRSDKSITSMVNLAETEQVTISQTKVPALPNTSVTVVKKTATAPPKDHLPMGTCRGAWHPKEGVEILPCGRATINKDETRVTSTLYVKGNVPYAAVWVLRVDEQDPTKTIKDRNLVICSIPDDKVELHACEISVILKGFPLDTEYIAAGTVTSVPSIPGSYASPHYTGTSSARFQATPE